MNDLRTHARWVMIDGRYPGIGKSTLAESLRDNLVAKGISVDHIPEEAIFNRPEFAKAATEFRQKEWPSEGAHILEGYATLAEKSASEGAWLIFDWGCAPMAEDLPWAQDLDKLTEHVRRVRTIVADLDPIVLFLDGDLEVALRRAIDGRGQAWLERYAGLASSRESHQESPWDRAARSMKENQIEVERNLFAYDAAGWNVERISAMASRDVVVSQALSILNL